MSAHTGTVRVVLADDHPIVLMAVSDQFSKLPGFVITATVNSGAELIRVLDKEPADLVITDLVMQGDEEVELDGLRLVSMLRRSHPDVPLVVLTMMASGGMFHELCKLGVAAIVSKEEPPSELARISLRALATKETIFSPKIQLRLAREGSTTKDLAREQPLSPRELEVVRLFAQGLSVTEIARTLNRSVPTVATQKRSAMRKLHVENHVDLVRYAARMGLA
ncbi:two-component system, response regulator [Caballeronia turbans]|jgi:two-component system capsular synthesis response regulator RcsB|uniref:response regulator transcription factor n=1 Tax=unclassified Caballeronia TaxID=2646786 RepID=UPI00074C4D85|nr:MULTISPECIES: response regulator transcription factor [unclassified Caballeronia]SAL23936.1 two-component system, response regulator [Caballeronia turbans]